MVCPSCMSPYAEPFMPEPEDGDPLPPEPLLLCTECDYVGPRPEFEPENYP